MVKSKTFTYEITVKESHLDIFKHVNNTVYAQFYEEARWDFITQNGMGLDAIERHQIGPIVLEMKIQFKQEIKNRERIRIESKCIELKRSKMVIEQKMFNQENVLVSDAQFICVIFDLKKRRALPPTNEWLHACGVELN